MLPQPSCNLQEGCTGHKHGACHIVSRCADWPGRISEASLSYRSEPIRDQDSFSCVKWIVIHTCSASGADWSDRISEGTLLYPLRPMAKQEGMLCCKNERMFVCKQNYPSVMEEVHRTIDCENGSNDLKSLSYTYYWLV